MGLSFWQVALVVLLMVLLFGRGKIPQLMSDLAQGIKSFKTGLNDGGGGEAAPAQLTDKPASAASNEVSRDKQQA